MLVIFGLPILEQSKIKSVGDDQLGRRGNN